MNRQKVDYSNSLEYLYPNLAKEWHPVKNGSLTPRDVSSKSGKKVWWLYPYNDSRTGKHFDFEWEAVVAARANGNGCPYLSNQKIWPGFNDLASLYPKLAKEWNYKRNTIISPSEISPNSRKKVWWICSKGHEWEAFVYSRVYGRSCPVCSGRIVVKGENDLESRFPAIAREYDITKNEKTPSQIHQFSHKNVWWICSEGHEYMKSVAKRTGRGDGCPYCSHKLPIIGKNDAGTLYPILLSEWNKEKNNGDKLENYLPTSKEKKWWICSEGHEYYMEIRHRTIDRQGCPYCSGQRVIIGTNDLMSKYPELRKEWSDKNRKSMNEFHAHSNTKAWWKCILCGYEWRAIINNRVKGKGCPNCAKTNK